RGGRAIAGLAVQERRPGQSSDLDHDPRHHVRYRQLPAGSGLRSVLSATLVVGDEAIGALTVLRGDVHHFTADEESLVSAFADQAAMALEHARLFSSVRGYSEQLEAMVAARTRELDEQKRFVEVVLETLPLGLFVLDGELRVDRAHALVLVEDVTLQKRLERQMLLTERLTTAGRLASGVAHELNNPLATIAGCAEALKERAQDRELVDLPGFKDFPSYLSVIEE